MTLTDFIALLTLLIALGVAAVTTVNYLQKHPEPKQIALRAGVVLLCFCLIFVAIGIFQDATQGTPAANSKLSDLFTKSGTSTLTLPSAADTPPLPTNTPTPLPTATPIPQPGTVLYRADWSNGMDSWGASADWKWSGGMIIDDGSTCGNGDQLPPPTLVPPYQPSTPDYSVEVQIQILRMTLPCLSEFGIVARGTPGDNGWTGYCAVMNFFDSNEDIWDYQQQLATSNFNPGTSWRTYRFEVHGTSLRVYIDGGLVIASSDAKYLGYGGQLGVWSNALYLNIRSYVVKQL